MVNTGVNSNFSQNEVRLVLLMSASLPVVAFGLSGSPTTLALHYFLQALISKCVSELSEVKRSLSFSSSD